MFLLGYFRLGNFIRFVPISVAGGFLAAAGCLMVSGAVLLATGLDPMNPETFNSISVLQMTKLSAVLILAAIYWYVSNFVENNLALPATILGSIFCAHFIFAYNGLSVSDAQALDLLLEVSGETKLFIPATQAVWDGITLSTFIAYLPETMAVIVVVGLAVLLIIAGVELEKEL